jgi:hypothetical protein
MTVCEAIVADRQNRVSLVHLLSTIRPAGYPARHPQLCVFAQLTECRGAADVRVVIRDADTDRPLFGSPARRVDFPNAPLTLHGLRFRLLDNPFPRPGLYWVELWYDNDVLAQTPLELR